MEFRFPHPFENIGDALRDALNPDNPEDGSLAVQLLNENNRAVEDRFATIVTGTFYSDNFTSGANAGNSYLFDPLVTLEEARWSVSLTVQGSVSSSGTWDEYIRLSIAADAAESFYSSSTGGVTGGSTTGTTDTLTFECLGGPIAVLCSVTPLLASGSVPASPISTFDVTIIANRLS